MATKSKTRDTKQPSASLPGSPTNLSGAELIPLLTPYVTAFGPAAARAVSTAIGDKQPLLVQALASWRDEDHYYLVLRLVNIIEHGVYFESIWMKKPENIPLEVARFRLGERNIEFGRSKILKLDWTPPERVLPIWLQPSGTLNEPVLAIRASTQVLHQNVSVKSVPHCTLGYSASRLDQVRNVAEEIKWVTRNQTQSGVFGD